MIIFLHGPDDYRRERKKKFYTEGFRKKYSNLGLGSFDLAENGSLGKLREFARSQSIFELRKLALVENAFEGESGGAARLFKELIRESKTTAIISGAKKPEDGFEFLLEKPVLNQRFDFLSGAEWLSYVKLLAKEARVELSPSAAELLAGVYRGNTWGLTTEFQKIASLKTGLVEKRDLGKLGLEVRPDYWSLMGGLRGREVRRRLWALERLFGLGEPTPKIFNILAAGSGAQIPRFAAYDIAVKSGRLDYEEALLDFAIS